MDMYQMGRKGDGKEKIREEETQDLDGQLM